MRVLPIVNVSLALLTAGQAVRGQEPGISPERRLATDSLRTLAADLYLTGAGGRRWLKELGVEPGKAAPERVLAVNIRGQLLLARTGEHSSVRFDAEMDTLLQTPGESVVLIHNHPANVGLSPSDLKQLAKPAVAAIVAIGHDGSVFVASAGAELDRELFLDSQYMPARDAMRSALRAEWPSGRMSVADGDDHFSHLVTLVLARTRVVQYWFQLQGNGRESFNRARMAFARVVELAAAGVGGKR